LAGGALTEWSVLHVPFSLEPVTNSAGTWVVLAFGVTLTARRVRESMVLSVVTFLSLVAGFYVAQDIRGWGVSHHQLALWSAASFIAGPLVGISAGWLRHGTRIAGGVGAGVLGGLLAGEAAHGLGQPSFLSPASYWHVQLVVGIVAAVGLPLWRSRRRLVESLPALAVSLGAGVAVGAITWVAYQVS
jgi:hypothetical protein